MQLLCCSNHFRRSERRSAPTYGERPFDGIFVLVHSFIMLVFGNVHHGAPVAGDSRGGKGKEAAPGAGKPSSPRPRRRDRSGTVEDRELSSAECEGGAMSTRHQF